MGQYDDDVKAKLGQGAWDVILAAVRNGHIDPEKMEDIARLLHPHIAGNHTRRERYCDVEMRRILSDWWIFELHVMTRQVALEKLVKIFNHDYVKLHPQAKEIKKLMNCLPKTRRHSSGRSRRNSYQQQVSTSEVMDQLKDQRGA